MAIQPSRSTTLTMRAQMSRALKEPEKEKKTPMHKTTLDKFLADKIPKTLAYAQNRVVPAAKEQLTKSPLVMYGAGATRKDDILIVEVVVSRGRGSLDTVIAADTDGRPNHGVPREKSTYAGSHEPYPEKRFSGWYMGGPGHITLALNSTLKRSTETVSPATTTTATNGGGGGGGGGGGDAIVDPEDSCKHPSQEKDLIPVIPNISFE
ncbi:hypothetical protein DL769_008072 [Monosporascus sp. CRB-8-3]|nr:hypothetical protein DL769_008072 [Monosporascus sp. CRB-8-3]